MATMLYPTFVEFATDSGPRFINPLYIILLEPETADTTKIFVLGQDDPVYVRGIAFEIATACSGNTPPI